MVTTWNRFLIFTFYTLTLFCVFDVHAVPYDYSYTLACTPVPEEPQYDGGITVNPVFDDGLEGWVATGGATLAHAESFDGNSYAVISNTVTLGSDGISQCFNAEMDKFYTVSAWFRTNVGEATAHVKVVTSTGNKTANWIIAKAGCWTMFKGGFHVNVTEPALLQIEANTIGIDLWVDSVSLQPFTQEEWDNHQVQSIEKVRKGKVIFEVMNGLGEPMVGAVVSIIQKEPHFPFGCALNGLIVENQQYQKWFLERGFKYSVFENELKWSFTEVMQGVENYSVADAMLEFAEKNNIKVRGHNILWDDPSLEFQPVWLNQSSDELREIALKRVSSVVNKYRGRFIHWDVINENMHYNLFSGVTNNGSDVFKLVHQLDPLPIPFLNEFNVIEGVSLQSRANPWRYFQKIEQLRNAGYHGPLGIGLEGHFDYVEPNFPYIRASIDMLHAAALQIWITEFNVATLRMPWMVKYVGPLLRELHSHPYVDGIILWSTVGPSQKPPGFACYMMCYTDAHYKNQPVGDVIDGFMKDFIRVPNSNGETDAAGVFKASLFHGEYEATVTLPDGAQPPAPQMFTLMPGREGTVLLSTCAIVLSQRCFEGILPDESSVVEDVLSAVKGERRFQKLIQWFSAR
ncbi:endo-1,4-beta-xylanase [Salvia divinorum]|uniref:Endo-1,4-beta-xylanase n=1 Tax=Salvia divinorum TaxID=28513 RepID=A0ABD1H8S8_SALDI